MRTHLTVANYRCFDDERPAHLIIEPGIISILGVNNAGKSALLRFFYEFRHLFTNLGGHQTWGSFENKGQVGFNTQGTDPQSMFHRGNTRDLSFTVRLEDEGISQREQVDMVKLACRRDNFGVELVEMSRDGVSLNRPYSSPPPAQMQFLCDAFRMLGDNIYIPAFRTPIPGSDNTLCDMPLGNSFVAMWSQASVGVLIVNREAIQRLQQQAAQLLGVRDCRLHLNAEQSGFLVEIDSQTLPIDEVGGGVSQILMILATVAARKPAILLCDEPEASLHPTLQIDFVSKLATYAKDTVVIATHSLGLARSVSARIFAVARDPVGGRSELKPLGGESEPNDLLGALQYSAARELGFDTVLLVEGSTEVLTLHQWLRWYELDHRVIVLSLGGSDMINGKREHALAEICRMSSRVFALIDNDKPSVAHPLPINRQQFCKTCEALKIDVHVLEECRALDNYFPDAAIKRFKGPKYRSLTPYEQLKDASPAWAKSETWRIAAQMHENELHPEIRGFLQRIKGTNVAPTRRDVVA